MKIILIIDDEPNASAAVRRVLSNHGYRIYTSISPVSGLEKVNSLKPDAVICDYHMPQMNGVECLTKMRELESGVIRILLTVGVDKDVVIEAVNRAGIDYYFQKPVDHSLLLKVLEKGFSYQDLLAQNRELAQGLAVANEKLSKINSELEIKVRERAGEIMERDFHLRKFVDEISGEIESLIKSHLVESLIKSHLVESDIYHDTDDEHNKTPLITNLFHSSKNDGSISQ